MGADIVMESIALTIPSGRFAPLPRTDRMMLSFDEFLHVMP
jgi:hypothetical protein